MGDDLGPVPAAPDRAADDAGLTEPEVLASIAAQAGLRRIHFVAWRDLDDPEAGGSELHAHKIASRWAAAGLDVTFRTSAVPDAPAALTRDGYRVMRRSGRYAVFPGAAWEGIRMGHRPGDALVEIWNGMPFLSPLWYRGPRIVFLHHVHAEMWGMVLPPMLARLGDTAERRIAPRFYRSSRIVTLSDSSRNEIVDLLGLGADRVTVAPPGVDERYTPGGQRLATPLVVAVGRLVPVKRFDALLRSLVRLKGESPPCGPSSSARATSGPRSRRCATSSGATDWISLPGRVEDAELGRVVPPGLGRGQQLAARGLGHDIDGGGRLRHPCRGHGDRRPCRRRARRRVGTAGGEPGRHGGRARAGPGRPGVAQPTVEGRVGPGALVHLGRHRPAAPWRRWPRRARRPAEPAPGRRRSVRVSPRSPRSAG